MKAENIMFNGNPISLGHNIALRTDHPRGIDLVKEASVSGELKSLFGFLAYQMALFKRPDQRTFDNTSRTTMQDVLTSARILFENDTLPLSVAQTVIARYKYGVSKKNLDPNVFIDNYLSHTPTDRQLYSWELTKEHVQKTLEQPATLAGSLLFIYYDGIDDNFTWMRRVTSGPYMGRWTVRGGHYDSLSEVAALEEAREEAGIHNFYHATPLGSADQVVAIKDPTGNIQLKHYLNLMWELSLPYNEGPITTEPEKPWREFADGEISVLKEKNLLTPIAESAFSLVPVF